MIKERLQFDSTTEVITRAKKLQLTVLQLTSFVCYIYFKTEQIKTGADLVTAVCLWVDNKTKFCSTVITALDTYQEMYLKSATQNDRY